MVRNSALAFYLASSSSSIIKFGAGFLRPISLSPVLLCVAKRTPLSHSWVYKGELTTDLPCSFSFESLCFHLCPKVLMFRTSASIIAAHIILCFVKVLICFWCWPKPLGLAAQSLGLAASHILEKQGIGKMQFEAKLQQSLMKAGYFSSQVQFPLQSYSMGASHHFLRHLVNQAVCWFPLTLPGEGQSHS